MSSPLFNAVADAVEYAAFESETKLPDDVLRVLKKSYESETYPAARGEFENIFENLKIASDKKVPICQDTGIFTIYITIPDNIPLTQEIYDAAAEGIKRATKSVPLRPNAVNPITRVNTKNNCGDEIPSIHITPAEKFTVTVLPKGAGSENMSQIKMLLPSETDKIADFVVQAVRDADAKPCPPIIVGVGIGGTFDKAASLSKEALLLPADEMTEFEKDICDKINALKIGAMGLGGDITAMAVKVKYAACHTASLPVAVNIQCWCCRRKTAEVKL